MVRTRRSIEEEERVHLLPDIKIPAYISEDELSKIFYFELFEEVLKWGAVPNKRALVVGLEDQGAFALELLKKGMFVVIVENDESKINTICEEARKLSLNLKLNHYAKDYMKIEFATTGFDFIAIPYSLNRYNEPLVVLRKAKRELKIGGKIFTRFLIKPDLPEIEWKGHVLPRLYKIFSSQNTAKLKEKIPEILPEKMGINYLKKEIKKEFKIEKIVNSPIILPLLADFVWKKGGFLKKIFLSNLETLINADNFLLKKLTVHFLGNLASFFLTKELELGKTFKVNYRDASYTKRKLVYPWNNFWTNKRLFSIIQFPLFLNISSAFCNL